MKKILDKNFLFGFVLTSGQIWCFGGGGGGGGVGLQGQKIKSCSEWPETHFGFGISEIQWTFRNFVSGHNQASKHPTKQNNGMYRYHSNQISRSARWGGATKN